MTSEATPQEEKQAQLVAASIIAAPLTVAIFSTDVHTACAMLKLVAAAVKTAPGGTKRILVSNAEELKVLATNNTDAQAQQYSRVRALPTNEWTRSLDYDYCVRL